MLTALRRIMRLAGPSSDLGFHDIAGSRCRMYVVKISPLAAIVCRLDRFDAMRALVGRADPVHVDPSHGTVPPNVMAVVSDSTLMSERVFAEVDAVVKTGATLVVLGDTLGSDPRIVSGLACRSLGELRPKSEWFVKLSAQAAPWSARLAQEIAVRGEFRDLDPQPDCDVLASVSVAYLDRPAIVARPHRGGRVITCSFGYDALLGSGELLRFVSRVAGGNIGRTSPVGMAVVGYGPLGGMGLHHGLGATATDGLEFVAVCDNSADRLKAASEQFPGVATYTALNELACDPDISVVVIATPPSTHADLAETLLRAGKHVVCEKPMCFTPAEADRLIDVARSHGVALTVHQNRRWDQDFLATKALLGSGALGELFNMETFVGGFDHPCRAWHSESSISGGAIYDWGAHYLDWTLLLMGDDPLKVSATGHKRVWRDVTNEDQVRVRLSWEDGREAEFVHSDVAAVRRPKLYLQGTKGTLVGSYRPVVFENIEPGIGYRSSEAHHAEAPAEMVFVSYDGPARLGEHRLALPPPLSFPFHANLADHLLLGEDLAVQPEAARNVVAVLDAAQRSLETGGSVIEMRGLLSS